MLAVVEDEDAENAIDVREDGIGLKVGEIQTWSLLAQVDEDRAGDVGVDGRRIVRHGPCWRTRRGRQQYCAEDSR